MRVAATFGLALVATAAQAQTGAPPGADANARRSLTATTAAEDSRRRGGGGGGLLEPVRRPDLSADFDPFSPDDTPPPKPPPFDPRRPALEADVDPLAALIRNGPAHATLSVAQSPEPWMLPGVRRVPTLADPPPGSAPATRPSAPARR